MNRLALWLELNKLRSEKTKYDATCKLGESNDPGVIEALIKLLGKSGETLETRVAALDALAYDRSPRAIEALITALNGHPAKFRAAAASALGRVKVPEGIPALAAKLRDHEEEGTVLFYVASALSSYGKEGLPPLMENMKSASATVRREIIGAVLNQREMTYYPLYKEAFEDSDPRVRQGAISAFRYLCSALLDANSPVPPLAMLISAVESSSDIPEGALDLSRIRPAVKERLERIPLDWWKTEEARRLIPYLLEQLNVDSYRSRIAAIEALGKVGDPQTCEPLKKILFVNKERGNSSGVCGEFKAAAESLTHIDPSWKDQTQTRESIAILIKNLVDPQPGLRGHSENALDAINPNWMQSTEAVEAVPLFTDTLLKSTEKYCRSSAASYLGRIGDQRAIDPLLSACSDKESNVSAAAREALKTFLTAEQLADKLKSAAPSEKALPSESAKQIRMRNLGVLFNIDDLGGAAYGYRAYKLLFGAIEFDDLKGCTLSDGDVGEWYCIAFESFDEARLHRIKSALFRCNTKGLAPRESRFIEGVRVVKQPLVTAGYVDVRGEMQNCEPGFVLQAWNESQDRSGKARPPESSDGISTKTAIEDEQSQE